MTNTTQHSSHSQTKSTSATTSATTPPSESPSSHPRLHEEEEQHPATPQQQDSAMATPHDSAVATPTSEAEPTSEQPPVNNNSSNNDSTHADSTDALHHAKQDQTLEAMDSDVNPDSLSTKEQLSDAVSTPINSGIEVIEAKSPKSHHQEHVDSKPVKSSNASTSHIKDVAPEHGTKKHEMATAAHSEKDSSAHSDNHHASHKRPTAAESEAQDYSAGVYKSPFRHAHKGQQAGKEQR
ncbi:hypothetical protein BGZ94_003273 [Podila epigama]|nr:hypothetical protein BGZ94_003273 [Podila epigama]